MNGVEDRSLAYIKVLLEHGADLEEYDSKGRTALTRAAHQDNYDTVCSLLGEVSYTVSTSVDFTCWRCFRKAYLCTTFPYSLVQRPNLLLVKLLFLVSLRDL